MAGSAIGFPDTVAGPVVSWWWNVVHAGAGDITQDDLDTHLSPAFRKRYPHYGDIEEFRKVGATTILSKAALREVSSEGEHRVRITVDAFALRFEIAIDVTAEWPHRIDHYRLGLAGGASLTALDMAIFRAVHHRVHSDWRVLDDPYAEVIGGELASHAIQHAASMTWTEAIAINTPARHRYAEDELLEAIGRGITQYVVLGAGLDSSALRHRDALVKAGVRVFEVDHLASQRWKLERFAAVGLALPDNVACVAVDFAVDDLTNSLSAHGFDQSKPAFVSWLGVSYYLALDAIRETLATIASWPQPTHIVFDYFLPPDTWNDGMRTQANDYEALGEPWLTFWTDAGVASLLEETGFAVVELVTTAEMIRRYAHAAPVKLDDTAVQHIAHAVVAP